MKIAPLSAEVAEAYDPKVTAALIRIYERETAELARLGTRRHLGEHVMNQLRAAAAEVERLTACLQKANANHEHFEREWYLRGDEIERLRAERNVILEENARLRAAVNSRTPCT